MIVHKKIGKTVLRGAAVQWISWVTGETKAEEWKWLQMCPAMWIRGNCEKTGEKGRRRELPAAKLHPLHAHLPPSLSHIRMLAFLPISFSSLPPPPTSSLFTLHRHPFRNMLLPQQQGGKVSSAWLTTRRCSDCHWLQYAVAQTHTVYW